MKTLLLLADIVFKLCYIICVISAGIYFIVLFVGWIRHRIKQKKELKDFDHEFGEGYIKLFNTLIEAKNLKNQVDFKEELNCLQDLNEMIIDRQNVIIKSLMSDLD